MAEELIGARKELERQSDTIVRIAKEKEDLTQDKATLTVQVTASERENRYGLIPVYFFPKELFKCKNYTKKKKKSIQNT